jgi:hypothetical protein
MDTLRILVVSQKGGVGKSTLSANLSVWFSEKAFKSTVLLDLDPHGSSSTWIREARSSGVVTEHHVLDDFDARRWLINSRNIVRRQVNKAEVLICDLTWTAAMDPEVLYEFDLIVVPTSVSSIELSATIRFIETIVGFLILRVVSRQLYSFVRQEFLKQNLRLTLSARVIFLYRSCFCLQFIMTTQ